MQKENGSPQWQRLLRRHPSAWAEVGGNEEHPHITGTVRFYETALGVVTVADIQGLPVGEGRCGHPIFGFHIHEGGRCTGNADDFFADTGTHYNPYGCPHPYHAGDLPPLFGADGYAFSVFLSNRFTVEEIVGRCVVIHSHPDDFTSQPAGNAGTKIACGEILRAGGLRRRMS